MILAWLLKRLGYEPYTDEKHAATLAYIEEQARGTATNPRYYPCTHGLHYGCTSCDPKGGS